jgi:hypothetical protein
LLPALSPGDVKSKLVSRSTIFFKMFCNMARKEVIDAFEGAFSGV